MSKPPINGRNPVWQSCRICGSPIYRPQRPVPWNPWRSNNRPSRAYGIPTPTGDVCSRQCRRKALRPQRERGPRP